MKKITKVKLLFWLAIGVLIATTSCKKENISKNLNENVDSNFVTSQDFNNKKISKEFKDYWYANNAEITSYKLEQARYGEIRNGKAILIYVTEDFLPKKQVKADKNNTNNIAVLKLNAVKKFNTGMYPYSIMQSTFYPVSNNKHAIKVSSSIQEWCGHVYTQLNNKEQFEIMSHSYFENEGDTSFKINKTILENELWTQLRIDPKSLPTGDLKIVPSFEYTRLRHIPIKAYKAVANLKNNTYSIAYQELNRTISINFNTSFPYNILGWEESYKSGFGDRAKIMTTKATQIKTIKTAYWKKHDNKDVILRDTLQIN
ncbi:septum formation inhibitor Maf [Thalassobellus suaedae]|uniref:Septum formation inhibitor Maf n=1 Tax=Thalassobellus suaedae TaxID=3074124 RepID=A0ABY9XV77_9FLAO|nr:septum formation inhibitor Maf [Flavobacteriaceae bacterium HL-DH14]